MELPIGAGVSKFLRHGQNIIRWGERVVPAMWNENAGAYRGLHAHIRWSENP